MPMKMGWRWYGEGNDPITLSDIKQIPGVTSIVWALHNKMPGEIWEIDEIQKVADQIHAYGFDMDVVESVNVHDDIKIGLPTRDKYIENYKQCIRNLSKFGVKVICYNFMPIFDWIFPQPAYLRHQLVLSLWRKTKRCLSNRTTKRINHFLP